MDKQLVSMEFDFGKASKRSLWRQISTASGLASWLANRVEARNEDEYLVDWGNNEVEPLRIINHKQKNALQYQWLSNQDDSSNTTSLQLSQSELTGEVSLIVSDYFSPSEIEDGETYWSSVIDQLRHSLGV